MYVQPGNKNVASTRFRRPFLDWYLISRRTFYQFVGGFLLLTGAIIGLYLWKRHQDALAGEFKSQAVRLVQVVGEVSVKRARTNQIERATTSTQLEPGDVIITASDGSAVIQYIDHSVLKMKPDSTVIIQQNAKNDKTDQQIVRNRVEGGTVNITTGAIRTAEDVNELATKGIKFSPGQNTSAEVSVRNNQTSATVERGEMRATNDRGVTESIPANTNVQYAEGGQKLGQYKLLPAPRLSSPENARIVPLEYGKALPVAFAWSSVAEAARYQMQLADSQYFLDRALIVDKETDGGGFTWTFNSQSGTYWWRVRALARDGRPGVWSEEFRLTIVPREPGKSDTPIYIGEVTVTREAAGVYRVSGRTEPGAEIQINGRTAPVNSDGQFSLTLRGQTFRIVASDARGRRGEKTVNN
ncbi:MAG: hypothetical protein NZ585_02675 [Chloracidobacterium sp.]|nr:hypothetical protein [Chloracidobacterium sp.]MDW8218770.1 hypothetical protein [Acidobacteriota bacterium]